MKSSEDLWLNEGMATWIAYKAVAAWRPQWNIGLKPLESINGVMNADSLASSRPVRSVDTPSDMSYYKSAAILRMVERYVGANTLRKALNSYIKRYAWGNARSEDLWNEIAAISGRPVDRIMASFMTQPGVPAVMVNTACQRGNTRLTLRQQRYILDQPAAQPIGPERWSIPVCFRHAAREQCVLLSAAEQRIALKGCGSVFANVDAAGYYRSLYDSRTSQALAADMRQRSNPAERMSLVSDGWAAVRAGWRDMGDFLNLTKSMAEDTEPAVLGLIDWHLAYLRDYIVSDSDRSAFEGWARTTFGPRLPAFLPGQRDDPALHESLIKKITGSTNAKERMDDTSRLALFEDPELIERTWTFLLSGQLTNAEARNLRSSLFSNPRARHIVWQFLQRDWTEIEKRGLLTPGLINQDLGQFCDAATHRQIAEFFQSRTLPAPVRPALERVLARVAECSAQRDRLQPQLGSWPSAR